MKMATGIALAQCPSCVRALGEEGVPLGLRKHAVADAAKKSHRFVFGRAHRMPHEGDTRASGMLPFASSMTSWRKLMPSMSPASENPKSCPQSAGEEPVIRTASSLENESSRGVLCWPDRMRSPETQQTRSRRARVVSVAFGLTAGHRFTRAPDVHGQGQPRPIPSHEDAPQCRGAPRRERPRRRPPPRERL